MERRTTEDYIKVLRKITEMIPISSEKVMSDFERAERKALQTVFPRAKVIGCFFHYSQIRNNSNKK